MKIIHISTYDYGGAGLAVLRLHRSLMSEGIDSKILVAHKTTDETNVFEANESSINKFIPPRNPILCFLKVLMRKLGFGIPKLEQLRKQLDLLRKKTFEPIPFSFPISSYDLSEHPLIKDADIIHLHWIGDFVDYETFFKKNDKPIVWTFHDENIAFGGFHYSDEANRQKKTYALLENQLFKIKRDALSENLNIHMVALSKQMERFYHNHCIQSNYPISIIHNGIKPDDFILLDRGYCRKVIGIPSNKTVICFCASDIHESRKGLDTLIKAIEQQENPNITLLCVGKGNLPNSSIDIIGTGSINNPRLLSIAYSAADLFAMPSYQEAFALTPLEAMACGCPVVAFPCGVTEELVSKSNGILCNDFTVESLSIGIQTALATTYNREDIREDVINRFNISKIAKQYIDLYHSIYKYSH